MNAHGPITESDRRALGAFAEAMPRPVVLVDGALRTLVRNALASTLLPALKVGDSLAIGLRAPQVLDAVRRVCAGGDAESVRWVERVPVEQIFDVAVAPLRLDGAFAVSVSITDLTDAMRTERMRTDFVANASHELRTPLASLLGFVETLQGPAREDPRAREQFLGIMRDQALRMSRLIDDLLSLSRIEQMQHMRPQGSVDLVSVVKHVVDTLGPLARETGALVSLEAPEHALAQGDRDDLIRLAENLIENAIKYGGRDGAPAQVAVSVANEAGQWVLSVTDNGAGVAPEHIPRLTERFFRTDAGVSRAKGGTGLGLAIVKHILARHRGRLVIDSKLGEGARFRAFLPEV